jgi:hypothetical protein
MPQGGTTILLCGAEVLTDNHADGLLLALNRHICGLAHLTLISDAKSESPVISNHLGIVSVSEDPTMRSTAGGATRWYMGYNTA